MYLPVLIKTDYRTLTREIQWHDAACISRKIPNAELNRRLLKARWLFPVDDAGRTKKRRYFMLLRTFLSFPVCLFHPEAK